jgi:preprotein translocase subunit SecG
MGVAEIILGIVLLVLAVALVALVLMQQGKDKGLGAIAGVSNNTETYWSKNKGRSTEGMLANITKICAVLFFVLALALNLKWFK